MHDKPNFPSKLLLLISLIQGLCLLYLHQSIELKFWPNDAPEWLFSFYSMAFVGPTMLLLGLENDRELRLLKCVVPFTLLAGLLGFYVGHQAIPLEFVKHDGLLVGFIATMAIATFKALMYCQQFTTNERFSYENLFRWSWRNFLTLFLSLLFAGCFWGLLMLWAALFEAIEIDFFKDLFTERWFFYPAIALANGVGIILFRNLSQVIDTITRIQQALMKLLLVMLVFVSMLFLGALAFTGLDTLWDSGGSSLILWMQAFLLFFVNAVYQGQSDTRPYPNWIHRFIYFGIAILPIYSVISFYGLTLRVDQYGWTVTRCWAVLIWFLLACFSVGYLWSVIKLRDQWLEKLSRVNVRMGLVVLAAMLVINSPAVDFRKISTASQLQRIQSGEVQAEEIDVYYFKRELARPGYLALQKIKADFSESNPEIVLKINNAYSTGREDNSVSFEEFIAAISIVSGEIPTDLAHKLYAEMQEHRWNTRYLKNYYFLELDVDSDGTSEFMFIEQRDYRNTITLYHLEGSEWKGARFIPKRFSDASDASFIEAVKTQNIKMEAPRWPDIRIGEELLRHDL